MRLKEVSFPHLFNQKFSKTLILKYCNLNLFAGDLCSFLHNVIVISLSCPQNVTEASVQNTPQIIYYSTPSFKKSLFWVEVKTGRFRVCIFKWK